ncbi:hypothetical protein N7523_001996 [Penicillium sp. IBT 18751x]|nr:hypothetical protein N7523_001996 [Penicillium sp. IBT 18751x]
MAIWFLFLTIQSLQWIAQAANASSHLSSLVASPRNTLHERSTGLYAAVLGGNGMIADGWPSIDQWVHSIEDMFESNKAVISASCSQWGLPNNSDDEINCIKDAIYQAEKSSGVDARFILSIVMQESKGCVRVQTTDNGVLNPGLMQSHQGSGSCNRDGNIQNPCPESEILQMIMDGVEGTPTGPGLKALIAQEGGTLDVTSFYKAARAYNSGAVASSGNLGQGDATHCYASDIANRLLGWTDGPSLCAPNVISMLSTAHWRSKCVTGACDRDGTSTTTSSRVATPSHVYSLSSNPGPGLLPSPSIPAFIPASAALLCHNTVPGACSREPSQV